MHKDFKIRAIKGRYTDVILQRLFKDNYINHTILCMVCSALDGIRKQLVAQNENK